MATTLCICKVTVELQLFHVVAIQGKSKRQSLQLLLIFQQCVHIFDWNFTQMLNSKIYSTLCRQLLLKYS